MAARPLVGILAAAGSGERLVRDGRYDHGTGARGKVAPKAFVRCRGRALLEWSLDALTAVCDRVVVVLPAGHGVAARPGREVAAVAGGPSRSESVRAGVLASPDARTYVVHDAARPLVTVELVERSVAALEEGWDGAVAAAPVTDTVKEADADGLVVRTLERAGLWSIQTPQAFRADALRRALDVGVERLAAATDDASLVEAAGGRVGIVQAPPDNLKVTRAIDLATAETLLAKRSC